MSDAPASAELAARRKALVAALAEVRSVHDGHPPHAIDCGCADCTECIADTLVRRGWRETRCMRCGQPISEGAFLRGFRYCSKACRREASGG